MCYISDMSDFATRLRQLRKEHNLRQIDLAAKLGLAQTTIANYEQHSRFPDEKTLRNIADHFEVSYDFLLGRTDLSIMPGPMGDFSGSPYANRQPLSPEAEKYLTLLIEGNREKAYEHIFNLVQSGMAVRAVYATIFEPCLKEIGRQWEVDKIDVSLEHYFSKATESLMAQLYPHIPKPKKKKGTAVLVAAGGELHEIGIKMVADYLEEAGWEVDYLGVYTPTTNLVMAIERRNADILAITASMSFNVDAAANMIRHIHSSISRKKRAIRIMVGGMAFNLDKGLWKRVGADGCARSAEEAAKLAEWWFRSA